MSRNGLLRCVAYILLTVVGMWGCTTCMPGKKHSGPMPATTTEQQALQDALRRDVYALAGRIGARNMLNMAAYRAAAEYIEAAFTNAGLTVARQEYEVDLFEGMTNPVSWNIEAEIRGTRSNEIIVVGAHYDTCYGTPGADDNASGVAGVLALARACAAMKPARTVRFVAFANEEPPCFQTRNMGSFVYARRCKERKENIVAMFSLEMIGYYTNAPHSQKYPFPFSMFYPDTGNFIVFVGNLSSRSLVRRSIGAFRGAAKFPSEGAAVPSWVGGVGLSDQWAFWQCGYPGIMVTDTSFFRYQWYHTQQDTPDKLNYDSMARVVEGMAAVVKAEAQ